MQFHYDKNEYDEAEAMTRARTAKYATTLLAGFANPNNTGLTGMQTPTEAENDYLYAVSSAGNVKFASATTSAVIIFDPEVSARSGQMHVNVYEYGGASTVLTQVPIGRPSTDFVNMGVVYSALKVQNASANDTVSGSQVHAVIQAIPTTLETISQSILISSVTDRSTDYVNVNSNADGTRSQILTNHLGNAASTVLSETLSNAATSVLYIQVDSSNTSAASPSALYVAGGLNSATPVLFNTALLTDRTVLPFSSSTYSARIAYSFTITDATSSVFIDNSNGLLVEFLDATGTAVTTRSVRGSHYPGVTAATLTATFVGESGIVLSSKPIRDIKITLTGTGDVTARLSDARFNLQLTSETSDISNRSIHVVRIDGVNSGASIQIEPEVVIAALPSSDRMFTANLKSSTEEIDTQFLTRILKSTFKSLDKVSTLSGHGFISNVMHANADGFATSLTEDSSMEAFSIKKLSHTLKKVSNVVKEARNVGSKAINSLSPVISMYSQSGLPGSEMAGTAATLIEKGRKTGVIKAMSNSERFTY